MNSVLETLQTGARGARPAATRPRRPPAPDTLLGLQADPIAYRLRGWPDLPERQRTARVYRLMSTMTVRPVHRGFMLAQSRMAPAELDALLVRLTSEQVLEVIDTSAFRQPASPQSGRAGFPAPNS